MRRAVRACRRGSKDGGDCSPAQEAVRCSADINGAFGRQQFVGTFLIRGGD